MEDQNKVVLIALAGLLHDIGKFAQRAGVGVSRTWDSQAEADYKYKHALLTQDFIEEYVPAPWKDQVKYLAANHHRPTNADEKIVRLADQLSAGERARVESPGQDDRTVHPKQLQSIFCSVTTNAPEPGKNLTAPATLYLPLEALRLDKDVIFPRSALEDEKLVWNAYAHLWDEFCAQAKQLRQVHEKNGDLTAYLENILYLLQRYTWCIPSAYYKAIPDVSLYDHARMTAALATCLSNASEPTIDQTLQALHTQVDPGKVQQEQLSQPIALLVGGDISGIQSFIYTLSSKGAAKTLRGRSFYLQLLTEAVLRFVLQSLDLPYTNVIYSGGGHFYVLAPLSAAVLLPKIQQEVTRKLLRHHGTSLYLAIGHATVPAGGFETGKFPKFWGDMHAALGRAKQQRYTELGDDFYHLLFEPPHHGGNPDNTCSVCGRDDHSIHQWDEEREEQASICSLCESFVEELGKPLPSAKFVVLGFTDAQEAKPGTAADALKEFGVQVKFLKNADDALNLTAASQVVVWAMDDPGHTGWPQSNSAPVNRLLRYTVNSIPRTKDGQPITFDKLQEQVKGGFKRLGVLRLDVDDLGDIFKSGLRNLSTLARLSTLSFQMSLFFEGWVKRICEAQAYEGLIYAVYAGGDDVFLIGPWDRIPELAQHITRDFAEYVTHHPGIHLSAGMAFIHGNYPIYQAAEDAKKTLDLAKDYAGKNAFGFLGQPWAWGSFTSVSNKHQQVHRIVGQKDAEVDGLDGPQKIIHVLRSLAENEADVVKRSKGRRVWGPWMWHGAYQLTRMAEQYKKGHPELSKAIEAIRDELDANNYSEINQWGTAARWTQLEIRKTREE